MPWYIKKYPIIVPWLHKHVSALNKIVTAQNASDVQIVLLAHDLYIESVSDQFLALDDTIHEDQIPLKDVKFEVENDTLFISSGSSNLEWKSQKDIIQKRVPFWEWNL